MELIKLSFEKEHEQVTKKTTEFALNTLFSRFLKGPAFSWRLTLRPIEHNWIPA